MDIDWEIKNGLKTGNGIAIERISILHRKLENMAKDEPWVEANDIEEKILQIKNKMAEIYCKETMEAY